jgi:hypothetical protein
MRASKGSGQVAGKNPEAVVKGEISEQDKVAVANIREAHSAWDRSRRDFEALVSKSAGHANTKGCKFELDLQALIPQGITLQFIETFKVMTICLFVVGGPPRSARSVPWDTPRRSRSYQKSILRTWRVSILSHHVTGTAEDEVLQKLERAFLRGDKFANGDLILAAATCTKLADLIKIGNKKASALKPWFNVD